MITSLIFFWGALNSGYCQTNKFRVNYSVIVDRLSVPASQVQVVLRHGPDPEFLCYGGNPIGTTCSGFIDTYVKPSALLVGTSSTSTGCTSSKTHTFSSDCEYTLSANSICGMDYHGYVNFESLVSTSGPSSSGYVYCPGEVINLTATSGFSTYTWQYRVGTGSWIDIKNTSTATTTVSGDDIGDNYI